MKIDLDELKTALGYLEANSNDLSVSIMEHINSIFLTGFDRAGRSIEIEIYNVEMVPRSLPKVRRSEVLRKQTK